ncbi:PREDICTED: zinc finger protein 766-like isoform X3 [Thamnophis sirtalis]|uniref:Zinc finger protein 766-like isoform X3 n=1 Tax=Thamnophis sirtalis TaxID=35019 RepID=A0A6I9YKK7_9SAUR|nr:PREDICTED: zinc finger protein 766-like isoform X3 [Thamnophis sirtalis]
METQLLASETTEKGPSAVQDGSCGDIGVGPVSFEEVAVYFSEGEWSQLDPDQKALHWEIMLENHRNMASLGNDGQENKDSGEPFQVIIAGDRMETSAIGMEIERDEKNQPDSWN